MILLQKIVSDPGIQLNFQFCSGCTDHPSNNVYGNPWTLATLLETAVANLIGTAFPLKKQKDDE